MVIGLDKLLPRVRKSELIENLASRELENPEGVGFDLRAGELYEITSGGSLGLEVRESSDVQLIAKYEEGSPHSVILTPGKYYLVKILESISLDDDMLGVFHSRSMLFRCGVVLISGVHPPGYSGAPSFGLYVAGPYPFTLDLGARIAHVNILRVDGDSSAYRGQWQGGRVATQGKEKQI